MLQGWKPWQKTAVAQTVSAIKKEPGEPASQHARNTSAKSVFLRCHAHIAASQLCSNSLWEPCRATTDLIKARDPSLFAPEGLFSRLTSWALLRGSIGSSFHMQALSLISCQRSRLDLHEGLQTSWNFWFDFRGGGCALLSKGGARMR